MRSLFGRQIRFDLSEGFPLVTTKRLHLKSIVQELIWFLNGDANIAYLKANGVSISDEWADSDGDLGPVYGKRWRAWEGADGRVYDQIALADRRDQAQPRFAAADRFGVEHRRHRADEAAALPLPVPVLRRQRQAVVPALPAFGRHFPRRAVRRRQLRAADPSRRARMGLGVGELVHTFSDAHLYLDHEMQAREQLSRAPRPLPRLALEPAQPSPRGALFDSKTDSIHFEGYDPWPAIKAPMAV